MEQVMSGISNRYIIKQQLFKMKTKKEELEAELTRLNALRKQVKEKLKALPVFEVVKWYLIDCEGYYSPTARNAIVYDNGEDYSYGFDFEGKFINDFNLSNGRQDVIREATLQEVEQVMIEEAKIRGLVNGVKINSLIDGYSAELKGDRYFFNPYPLYFNLGSRHIFANGKWATVIEQDKFAELKEAHRNGAVIQINNMYGGWSDVVDNSDFWLENYDYRIKPEEKPKVGDVVKCWYNDSPTEFLIKIADEEDLTIFPNIKVITQQEAINLLFNKGAN